MWPQGNGGHHKSKCRKIKRSKGEQVILEKEPYDGLISEMETCGWNDTKNNKMDTKIWLL